MSAVNPGGPAGRDPRRVLHVIDKSMIGGGQHNVVTLVSHLDRARFAPQVACSPGGPLVETLRERGVPVWPIPMSKRFSPASFAALYRRLGEEGVELVHAHGLVATSFVTFPARARGLPVIYSQHGYHHRNYSGAARRARIATEKLFIRRMQAVICDSEADRDYGRARGYFRRDPQVLPPPVDVERLQAPEREVSALRRALGLEGVFPVLGTVGRLDVAKGHPHLLEALPRVREAFPALRFLFVGEGPERGDLEARVRSLGLQDCVHLVGRAPSIPPYLGLLDLYVSSSLWEGLPVAICEAMAAGAPVVATAVGGCPEVVRDGETGRVVESANAPALAAAMIELLGDDARRRALGAAGRARIRAHYSVEAVLPRLEELYQHLLGTEPRA